MLVGYLRGFSLLLLFVLLTETNKTTGKQSNKENKKTALEDKISRLHLTTSDGLFGPIFSG